MVESRLKDWDSKNQVREGRFLNIEDKLQQINEGVNTFKSEIARVAVQISQIHDLVYHSFNRVDLEVENTEIVFDSAEELIEVPDPESTPIKAICGSDLVSPMLNLPELEGDEPEHEPETRSLVKEIKPPDSEIATYLVKTQEATIEATSAAENTKPWPDNTHVHTFYKTHTTEALNRILQLTQGGKTHRIQLLNELNSDGPFRTSPVTTKDRLVAQPVPPSTDIFLLLYDFQNLKFQQRGMSSSSRAAADIEAKKLLLASHHRFRSTLSGATATNEACNSVGLSKTSGDPGMIMADEATLVASMPIQRKEMKIVGGDRLRSRPGRLPTSFLAFVRLRSRPKRQLLDSPEANRVLNWFQNRVLAGAQLQNLVIAILRHLPEFDPGDQRPIEDDGALSFNLGAVSLATVTITITRRLATHRRACSTAGQPKPYPDLFVEVHEGLKKKEFGDFWLGFRLLGISKDNLKKLGIFWKSGLKNQRKIKRNLGVRFCDRIKGEELGIGLLSERRENFKVWTPNPNSIQCRFGALVIGLAEALCGEPGQKCKWANWAALKLTIPSAFGDLDQQQIWANIAIGFPFQVP